MPLTSANKDGNKDTGSKVEPSEARVLKENVPVLALLVAGVIFSALLIGWWRGKSDLPSVQKRLALPGELSNSALAAKGDAPVRIGETFKKFDGVPSKQGGTWPTFRGVNHDNISTETVKLSDSWPQSGPPVVWSVDLGEGYAGPVIFNGCAYILDYDGKEDSDALRCFSMDNGKELWRRSYRVHIKRNHGMSRTVPAVAGSNLVTIGPRCHVMCVDPQSGDLKWGIDLEKEWGTTVPMWYTGQCPLIDGDEVIIAPGGKALLIGVDINTGKVRWQTPNPKGWVMSHSSVIPMQLHGKKMYVYCAVGGIAGVSAEKDDRGKVLWETAEWNHQVVAPAPVSIGDGRVFVTAGYGEGSAMFNVSLDGAVFSVKQLYTLDKKIFACEQHTPILYKGFLYTVLPADAGAAKRQAVCMDPDRKIAWSSGSAEKFGLGPFMIADNKIFIMEDNGVLTMIKATEAGYSKLGQARVLDGKEAWAPMALADGRLLVRDYGKMSCLDLRAAK